MSPIDSSRSRWKSVLAWFQLARLSATPSAVTNILVGYLIVHADWSPGWQVLALIVSSVSLYSLGMISNDLFDVERDRQTGRRRPLVEGRISIRAAVIACLILLAVAWIAAGLVGPASLSIALALSVSIYLYNGPFKATWFGPGLMGLCRGLNVLLGAGAIAVSWSDVAGEGIQPLIEASASAWWPTGIWISGSLMILIAGITVLARDEATGGNRGSVIGGIVGIALGWIGLAGTYRLPLASPQFAPRFPWLMALLAVPLVPRFLKTAIDPQPKRIQGSVIAMLRSLIPLDAALALLLTGRMAPALWVLAWWIPSWWLSRRVSST